MELDVYKLQVRETEMSNSRFHVAEIDCPANVGRLLPKLGPSIFTCLEVEISMPGSTRGKKTWIKHTQHKTLFLIPGEYKRD
jgi:hypothetical protein